MTNSAYAEEHKSDMYLDGEMMQEILVTMIRPRLERVTTKMVLELRDQT